MKALAAEKTGALAPSDTVETAAKRMQAVNAKTWPVVEDRKLVGVIDERHPDREIGGHGHDPKTWRVGEIMKRDAIFCYEDEGCEVARHLMTEHGVDYLPVVDRERRLVGIFDRQELTRKIEESRSR